MSAWTQRAAIAMLLGALGCGRVGFGEEALFQGDAGNDSEADASASDDAAVPAENLLANEDCDTLDGWGSYNGVLSLSATARTGSGSCMVCTIGGENVSSLDSPNGINEVGTPVPNALYRGEAWVFPVDTDATIFAALRTWRGGSIGEVTEGDYLLLPANQWSRVEVSMRLDAQPADFLDLYVFHTDAAGDCMLVDDLRLERVSE